MADLPENLFPIDILAEAIRELKQEVKIIKQRFMEATTLEDLESGEPGMEIQFQNPMLTAQNQYFNTRITSITNDQMTVTAIRLIPSTDTTSPWMDDSAFTGKPMTAKVPTGIIPPIVGGQALIYFTGLSNGSSQYAVFTFAGTQRVKVKTIGTNTLTCKMLTAAGDETGPDLTVARPFELRRSTYDGQTIDDITYTHLDSDYRSGTDGSTTETQIVIPPYVAGHSKILVAKIPNEDSSLSAFATDLNEAGRAWAVEA